MGALLAEESLGHCVPVLRDRLQLGGRLGQRDVDDLVPVQRRHAPEAALGDELAREIQERTGYETRVTVLGHVQRGGSPTPRDRVLATRYGLKAADLVLSGSWGRMAALQGDTVLDVSLKEATAELKTVPPQWYDVAQAFFG